ncbi:hypothetical protein BCR42DRAFT_414336 [Absidia repens]|uniref:G-patch domain-containing protein n=1 Tax=Absidia repens TaxID=90262 RepID=A0A1X2IIP9_9FUNG|nr:hypothetical protein BCR42DRAFT_414336 [Absidia repens]
MSGNTYRNTRGKSNKGGRYTSNTYFNHQQQACNTHIESSFAQLNMNNQDDHNDIPMRPHFGLGYSSHSTPVSATPTHPAFTKRFVPASKNIDATDPALQQPNNNIGSSSSHDSCGNFIGSTTTDTVSNNNDTRAAEAFTEIDVNGNSREQQDTSPFVQDNTTQRNSYVQLGHNNSTPSQRSDTNPSGTATDIGKDGSESWKQQKWMTETGGPEDDQQPYSTLHGMDNDNKVYEYEYDDASADGDDYDRTVRQPQDDADEDVFDFGLCDSDDDEYIQAYMAYQQYHQQQSYQSTMISHFHPDMQYHHNQHYHPPMPSQQQQNLKYRWYEDSPSGQLRRVDRRVQLFISDPSRETYQLPGMSMYCRRQVQGLATLYKLKMSHEDVGNNKTGPLLKKGPRTQLPVDRRAIEKHINKIRTAEKAKKQMERRPGGAASELLKRTRKEERRRLKGLPAMDVASKSSSTKKSIPRTVGSEAAPLASNNIGHRMMASMGWKEGESLGVNNDGISNPIQPIIRTNRRGLGA